MVKANLRHPVEYLQLTQNYDTNWKKEGMQLKLADIIHQMCPEDWDLEKLTEISSQLSRFIETLIIHHLNPLKKHEHRYTDEVLDSPPIEVCHHGSLEFLGHLSRLHTLSLIFAPNDLFRSYRREAFECSYEDINNLAKYFETFLNQPINFF